MVNLESISEEITINKLIFNNNYCEYCNGLKISNNLGQIYFT